MKISSLQENLKNGLFIVGHIAGKNINLPILNNVMIKSVQGDIKLITTDLETGITSRVRGKIEKEGEFTIESKILSDYIALLPNQKVDLEINENNASVKCENYKTTIKGESSEEYPLVPEVEKKVYFKVDVNDFKKALSQVVFAVSNSETRMELSGVFFSFNKEKLIMAATDSYRLAEKSINIKTNTEEEKNVIIPAKALQEVIRIISILKNEELQENKDITFYLSDNQILFIIGNTEIISRLIDGQYPDYKQIIPINCKTKAKINRLELLRAVKAAALSGVAGRATGLLDAK